MPWFDNIHALLNDSLRVSKDVVSNTGSSRQLSISALDAVLWGQPALPGTTTVTPALQSGVTYFRDGGEGQDLQSQVCGSNDCQQPLSTDKYS